MDWARIGPVKKKGERHLAIKERLILHLKMNVIFFFLFILLKNKDIGLSDEM